MFIYGGIELRSKSIPSDNYSIRFNCSCCLPTHPDYRPQWPIIFIIIVYTLDYVNSITAIVIHTFCR